MSPPVRNDVARYWLSGYSPRWTRISALLGVLVGVAFAILTGGGMLLAVIAAFAAVLVFHGAGLAVQKRRGRLPRRPDAS